MRTSTRRGGSRPPSARSTAALASLSGLTPSYSQLFTIEGFGRLVSGMLLGRIAQQMLFLVLVLFVLERYGSATLAGITAFLQIAPGLVVSPIAGTLLDRHGRRTFIVLDYAVAASAVTLIALLALGNALPVTVLLLIVTASSLTNPLSSTGMRTLFPLVVPRGLWERANAIDSNGYAVSSIVAPAVAGSLFALLHGEGALLVTAGLYAAAAVVTLGVQEPRAMGHAPGPLLRAAWEGVIHVARHPTLRGLAITVSVSNVSNGIFFIAVPVAILHSLGGTPEAVGRVFTLMGIAAFVSVTLFGRMRTEGRERTLMTWSVAGVALGIGIAFARLDFLGIALGALVIGAATGPYDIAMFTLRQRRTDPAWLGRAFAVSMALNFVGFPVGSAIGGGLSAVGPDVALGAALGIGVVAIVLTYLTLPRD